MLDLVHPARAGWVVASCFRLGGVEAEWTVREVRNSDQRMDSVCMVALEPAPHCYPVGFEGAKPTLISRGHYCVQRAGYVAYMPLWMEDSEERVPDELGPVG